MKLPKQSKPVLRASRGRSPAVASGGISPSDPVKCAICMTACEVVPWPLSIACRVACNEWACP